MDDEYQYLTCDVRERIATITIDNPGDANTLTASLATELVELLKRVEKSDARAVILTGTDGYFSSGADISSFDMSSVDAVSGDLFEKVNPYDAIESLNQPVIAAVDGIAFAGGFELALVCDLVVVGEDIEIGLPEATLGIVPGIAMLRLTDQLGKHQALEIMMTGESLTGAEAIELGLFNRAVPQDSVQDEARELAEKIAENAPTAITVLKKVVNREYGGDYAINELALGTVFGTEDIDRGKEAFLEGENANFQGE